MRTPDFMREEGTLTECLLCPNRCRIADGRRGRCLARGREQGRGVLHNYAQVTSAHVDPVEKKPLYHFHPGRPIFSIGSYGCNLACRFCQNYEISQQICPTEPVQPDRLAEWAAEVPGNIGVAFTYNEPGIWYEYIVDAAPFLKKRDLSVVMVTNGYLEPEPWRNLCGVVDAMNIDLKGFTPEFYRDITRGALEPVLANITTAVRAGVHVELTNLVVPGLNDDPAVFGRMIDWIAALSPELPLHLSRYFPRFHEHAPPTPPETLEAFARTANERLRYVYVGNLATEHGQDTLCPACRAPVIRRSGYHVEVVRRSATCSCGNRLPIKGFEDHD
ncbi:MAG TPA: AmmeMemoRadiSam system radical SAM enzyme [Candidatus Ozemobacteraceae bacterium]|nr:AmmeMemoRadiSam system radical SAM enzyme [Candidatus Ozemobacteraceae bacterium]